MSQNDSLPAKPVSEILWDVNLNLTLDRIRTRRGYEPKSFYGWAYGARQMARLMLRAAMRHPEWAYAWDRYLDEHSMIGEIEMVEQDLDQLADQFVRELPFSQSDLSSS